MSKAPQLNIMVASSIYGFEDQLTQICAMLKRYRLDVWNSHIKTIPVHPGFSNVGNCLKAVEDCDVFLGIIRSRYGAVVEEDISITHQEIRKAIELNKPRWLIAETSVVLARQLLKQYRFDAEGKPNPSFRFVKTSVLDDIRSVQLYEEAIREALRPVERTGNWVEEFYRLGDLFQVVETQFKNQARLRNIVNEMRTN